MNKEKNDRNLKSNKKILLISHEMSYTGAPRSLLQLAEVLQSLKYDVSVWTLKTGSFENEFKKININVKSAKKEVNNTSIFYKFNVIILNTLFSAKMLDIIPDQIRTILYVREAHNIPDLLIEGEHIDKYINIAKEIICVSEYAKDFITENYNPANIHVIHNFIKDSCRPRLNLIRGGKINFLISGTVEWRKGQDNVIRAFEEFPEELKKISRLHIAGSMPEWSMDFWEGLIPQDDPRIIYHGEITDEAERLRLYDEMNVFVVASRDESCSLVALEGAMLGKAVLMSDNVGAKYLYISGEKTFPIEDPGLLSQKMREMTSRKKLLIEGIRMRCAYLRTSTRRTYKKKIKRIL